VKVFVLHDAAGAIKSVIRLDQEVEVGAIVAPGEEETVTEIPAEGVAAELEPLEIHENYRIDVATGALVRDEELD
jgi:hypothetical protein